MIWKEIELNEETVVRTFGEDIDPIELKWHRDDESRELELIEGIGWRIQLDNQLPIELTKTARINIKKHDWHRLIKGDGNLIVKIYKS